EAREPAYPARRRCGTAEKLLASTPSPRAPVHAIHRCAHSRPGHEGSKSLRKRCQLGRPSGSRDRRHKVTAPATSESVQAPPEIREILHSPSCRKDGSRPGIPKGIPG